MSSDGDKRRRNFRAKKMRMSADDLFRFKLGEKVRTHQDDVGTVTERRRHESFYASAKITYWVSLPGSLRAPFREDDLQPYRCKCPDCIDERYREQVEEKVHFLMVNLGDGKQFENLLFKFAKEMLEMGREPATKFNLGDKVRILGGNSETEIREIVVGYRLVARGDWGIWAEEDLELVEEEG